MKNLTMLKIISRFALISSLAFISAPSFADFNFDGQLKITFPSGAKKEMPFPLSYSQKDGKHIFVVGPNSFNVAGQPKSYSFAMLLKTNNYAWLQEFSNNQFKSFSLTLGEHKLALSKQILNEPVKGDYILTINDTDYFFQNRMAQINFIFNDDGIEEIEVDGMTVSLGLNKLKNPCHEFEEDSEERAECELDK